MPAELSGNGDGPHGATTGDGVGIQLSGVGKRFGEIVALRGIDFEVQRHSRIGIVGPSGGGKSTLLHIVAGLMEPDTGEVNVEGATAASERLARCALMPQRDLLLPWRTALDNATIALENRGMSRSEARSRTRPLFARFGLAMFEEVRPAQLSGGMRQRVSFLRTLVADKDVLLLDEPFGALDARVRKQLRQWLRTLHDEVKVTTVLVTHDSEEACEVADRVAVMHEGRIAQIGTAAELGREAGNPFLESFLGDSARKSGARVNYH